MRLQQQRSQKPRWPAENGKMLHFRYFQRSFFGQNYIEHMRLPGDRHQYCWLGRLRASGQQYCDTLLRILYIFIIFSLFVLIITRLLILFFLPHGTTSRAIYGQFGQFLSHNYLSLVYGRLTTLSSAKCYWPPQKFQRIPDFFEQRFLVESRTEIV